MATKQSTFKRPSYHAACQWIALNDNAGNGDSLSDIESYLTVAMVADCWGLPTSQVALAVYQTRLQIDAKAAA